MFLVTNQLNNKKVAGVFSELQLDSQKMWIAVLLCATTCKHATVVVVVTLYDPGLKGLPGASSVWIVRPSVRLSIYLFFRNSVPLTNKVQYLKFGWSYSNQTKGCSHFNDISCPWGMGRVKM